MSTLGVQKLLRKADLLTAPLAYAYHKTKENTFLNTQFDGAKGLEAAGNFFLRYSVQYLFNGRTITELSPVKSRQTFNYQKDSRGIEFLKTAVAIVALPLLLLVGSVLKGLSYLSTAVRERHQAIEVNRTNTQVVSTDYTQLGIDQVFSNELVPHQACPHPELTSKQKLQLETVYAVADLLEQNNIPYWLDCGSLLGAYRHGTMIPWDHDVDLGILTVDHRNVARVLRNLDPKKYVVQDWSSGRAPDLFLRVLIKKDNSYLDLYHHKMEPGNESLVYEYSWTDSPWVWADTKQREFVTQKPIPRDEVFPLKKMQFGNRHLRIPAQLEPVLKRKYGETLEPCKIWNAATQQYDRVPGHPYWALNPY